MSRMACCALDEFLLAMSDETRQQIVALLGEGEMSVSRITEHFALSQPTISHHLAILRRAGVLTSRREGRQVFYRTHRDCVDECCREIQGRFGRRESAHPTRQATA